MAIAKKTYFQKIADPEDIVPTTAIAFTVNHISAVFLPIILGFVWRIKPELVFLFASVLAFISLIFSFFIPNFPKQNKTSIFS